MNRRQSRSLQQLATLTAMSGCLWFSNPAFSQPDTTALEAEARTLTQRFVGELLPTLQKALADDGPVAAIEVCANRAPAIAAALSAESGWSVTRVSLKPRNAGTARPDIWETAVLEIFDQRQAAGEPGPTLNAFAIENDDFRYMQAQPVLPLCLTCHGQQVSDEVLSALAVHYPGDMATGYLEGQIRGAISLRRALP
jgi:hypothetical protein